MNNSQRKSIYNQRLLKLKIKESKMRFKDKMKNYKGIIVFQSKKDYSKDTRQMKIDIEIIQKNQSSKLYGKKN